MRSSHLLVVFLATLGTGLLACSGSSVPDSQTVPIGVGGTLPPTVAVVATPTTVVTANVPGTAGGASTASPIPAASASVSPTLPPAAVTTAPQPTPLPRASESSLTVRAAAGAFDRTSIRVFAGTTITATLQNDEVGVAHNLAFSLPGLGHGETCVGPCTATQTFKAEKAGSYFFLCTIHDMSGTFIVDP